jgi:hypothetical protein
MDEKFQEDTVKEKVSARTANVDAVCGVPIVQAGRAPEVLRV